MKLLETIENKCPAFQNGKAQTQTSIGVVLQRHNLSLVSKTSVKLYQLS